MILTSFRHDEIRHIFLIMCVLVGRSSVRPGWIVRDSCRRLLLTFLDGISLDEPSVKDDDEVVVSNAEAAVSCSSKRNY